MTALICDSDRCPSVHPKGWQRYQRCRATMRANVRPARWERLTVRGADRRANSGGSGDGSDGRSSRCEGEDGLFGCDRNSQRVSPLHASSAPSELVVGGKSAWLSKRGGKSRSGEPTHEYLIGCVDHIYWSVICEHASRSLYSAIVLFWRAVQFVCCLLAFKNIPCSICVRVKGWKSS